MHSLGLTVHMVVKNEDQWVWYAIQSVLPYADSVLITDTGSSDRTVDIIKSIKSPKIDFQEVVAGTPAEVTAVRQVQVAQTHTPWIWVVDGDEIYPESVAKEVVALCQNKGFDIGLVRRYDLLGDIYHRQVETVGTYNLFGHSGHMLIRCVRRSVFPGLHYGGDYPNEGLFNGDGVSLLEADNKRVWITKGALYHSMYLRRSSVGATIRSMMNRSKYKIEKGITIEGEYPAVFDSPGPRGTNPRGHRSLAYEIGASLLTPIKRLKRLVA